MAVPVTDRTPVLQFSGRPWHPEIEENLRLKFSRVVAAVEAYKRKKDLSGFVVVQEFVLACGDYRVAMEILNSKTSLRWLAFETWKLDWRKANSRISQLS